MAVCLLSVVILVNSGYPEIGDQGCVSGGFSVASADVFATGESCGRKER